MCLIDAAYGIRDAKQLRTSQFRKIALKGCLSIARPQMSAALIEPT